jgi:hypothetical protein
MRMKKVLPILSLAVVMAACNTNPSLISQTKEEVSKEQKAAEMKQDTTGFAQYQSQQAQQEIILTEEVEAPVKTTAVAPVKRVAPVKKAQAAPVRKASVAAAPKKARATKSTASSSSNTNAGAGNSGSEGSGNEGVVKGNESAPAAEAEEKKGISKAAKGAVVGAVGGAAAGAVINKKNRTVGAVIGAVIGAGGGYVVGRTQDKKDGRY